MRLPLLFAAALVLCAGPAAAGTFHPYKSKGYGGSSEKSRSTYGIKPAGAYRPHAPGSEPSQSSAFKPWKPSSTTSVFGPEKPKRAH